MHNYRAVPLKDGQPAMTSRRPRIGFLRPGHVEQAFLVLLYVALAILVVLSVLGTFYGRKGIEAPLSAPLRIIADIQADGSGLAFAVAIQFVLTLIQYGARQFARRDPRWWLLYLAALGVSVYYNLQAYWTPLTALGVAWYIALAIILAGDIVPEIAAVQQT